MRAKEVAQRARLDALASLPIAMGVDLEELGPEEEGRGLSAQPGWVRTTRLKRVMFFRCVSPVAMKRSCTHSSTWVLYSCRHGHSLAGQLSSGLTDQRCQGGVDVVLSGYDQIGEDMREELNARVAILRSEHRILLDELRARGCEPAVVPEEPMVEGLGFDQGMAAEMGLGAETPGR